MTGLAQCGILVVEIRERGVKIMTKEGADIVREAVKAIYEQCEATGLCGNCPLCDHKDLSCDDLFECISNR